jgi:CBS domain containing-hemolysin-like protein
MPDSDPTSGSDSHSHTRNLPAVIPQPGPKRESGWLSRTLRTLFGWNNGSVRANLRDTLDAATPDDSGFTPDESRMLKNILGLRERRMQDVMVPRADIIAVQQDISLGELMLVFESAAHSRLVVYNDTLDDPIGMVHIRDLVAFMAARAAAPPAKAAKRKKPLPAGLDLKSINLALPLSSVKIVRELLFVPPSMRVIDLLARMQATRTQLALVIDEYGGTDGIVSIEDIVEQIVGEIADEHDDDVMPEVMRQADGSFMADARAPLEHVVAMIGADFNIGDAAKEIDTIGGYLMSRAGRVPVRGELVSGPGLYEIEVAEADPRRVKRVRIYKLKERRERSRDQRRRGEPDAPLANTPPISPASEAADDTKQRP